MCKNLGEQSEPFKQRVVRCRRCRTKSLKESCLWRTWGNRIARFGGKVKIEHNIGINRSWFFRDETSPRFSPWANEMNDWLRKSELAKFPRKINLGKMPSWGIFLLMPV